MTWHHAWIARIELTGTAPAEKDKMRAQLRSDLEKGIRDLALSGGYRVLKVRVEFNEEDDSKHL
jgi:hypothetical protein